MKPFRHLVTLVCVVASCIAHTEEQPATGATGAVHDPIAVELQRLQGTWKGVMVGQENNGDIIVTITGDSLHFHRDTNFWFKTRFTQPDGTESRQLRFTINEAAPGQESSVGEVVVALYKIDDGTLTLVALGGDDEESPKSVEAAEDSGLTRYKLRKVPPQNKGSGPPKTQ